MTTAEPKQTTRSQTDVVISGIKAMIISGELTAGSRLPVEKDLSATLNVSRGSLREGVRALATLGILETRQGDGTYVTALNPASLLGSLGLLADLTPDAGTSDLLAVRRVLESEAAALAACRLTPAALEEMTELLDSTEARIADASEEDLEAIIEADSAFHRMIAQASGNEPLTALIDSLMTRTFRARLWRAITEGGAVRSAHNEHVAILTELRTGDPDRARLRMAVHLLGVEEFMHEHSTDSAT